MSIVSHPLIACDSLPKIARIDGSMKSALYLCSCLLVLALSVCSFVSAQAQELIFTLSERVVIGDDEDAPAEYLFTRPGIVRTDSQGNVYISDERRADVRVFDGAGQYITTIGQRGDGPGELREVFGMHVDAHDRLIVADRPNQRFTVFADFGKSIETKAFPDDAWGEPDPILSLKDGFVLNYVRLYDDSDGRLPYSTDTKTLHLYDSDLNHREAFADLDALFDLSEPFEMANSSAADALMMATNGTDQIILVPQVYSGIVYWYTHSNDSWHMEALTGGPGPKNPYMTVSSKDHESKLELRRFSVAVARPSGVFYARVFAWSLGVFVLSTGEVINFTRLTPLRGEISLQAELFDASGNLLGHGPVRFDDSALTSNKKTLSRFEILWVDDNDQVYLRRPNDKGFYVLSIAELTIERE